MATVVQVVLQSERSHRTCWLDTSKKFQVGDELTLKNSEEPERRWRVNTIGEPKDASEVRTDWNVGGVKSRR